jgi:hypothetical protein
MVIPKCDNCRKPMVWTAHATSFRPDARGKGRNGERAPIRLDWHCRCGSWKFDTPWLKGEELEEKKKAGSEQGASSAKAG